VLVALHGATQVISWRTADGRERLYLSPIAELPSHYSGWGPAVFSPVQYNVFWWPAVGQTWLCTHPALGEVHGSDLTRMPRDLRVHAGAERQRRHVGAMASYFAAG
jgi:hypothetical protein